MQHRARPVAIWIVVVGVLAGTSPAFGRRVRCEVRCGFRIAECVLARGGVDGAEIAGCRRDAVAACQTRGRRACPCPRETPS